MKAFPDSRAARRCIVVTLAGVIALLIGWMGRAAFDQAVHTQERIDSFIVSYEWNEVLARRARSDIAISKTKLEGIQGIDRIRDRTSELENLRREKQIAEILGKLDAIESALKSKNDSP